MGEETDSKTVDETKPPSDSSGGGDTTVPVTGGPGENKPPGEPPVQIPIQAPADKKEGDVSANSSGTQRTDAAATSSSGGSGTGPEGHQTSGKPGDGGGDSGQNGQSAGGGATATKVTPSTAADKLIPDKPKPVAKSGEPDEPKFRGPAPLRRWRQRHHDTKKTVST